MSRYIQNTHAATHNQYTLDVESAFVLTRDGEDDRFKAFEKVRASPALLFIP